MLKKQNRLRTKFEFKITHKYGKKINSENFSVFTLFPTNYKGLPKIGLMVTNKLYKNATERNKMKRIYRELVRKNLQEIPKDSWMVIHPKVTSENKSYEELSVEFVEILQKIHITKEPGLKNM